MKKKNIALLSLVSLLTLTSCIFFSQNVVRRDLSYSFTESDEKTLRTRMQNFEEYITGDSSKNPLLTWSLINRTAYDIATIRTIENVNYAKGDDSAYDRYLHYQDLLFDVAKWQESQYVNIYNSSYKDTFFEGMTEEEIADLINNVKPEAYYDYENQIDEYAKQFNDLSRESIVQNPETVDNIYKEMVKIRNNEAKLFNCDSYMDFAYKEEYSRDYTSSDVATFDTYVKDYIVPLFISLNPKEEEKRNSLTNSDLLEYVDFLKNTNKQYKNYSSILSNYANFIGGKYKSNYQYIVKSGYIVTGGANANIDGAFTAYLYSTNLSEPIMYLGPDYQDVMTFVHEFGHYNAFMVNGGGALSYDLAETQSQGNEGLFIAYLKARGIFSDNLVDCIGLAHTIDALRTIILATIINRFENSVYSQTDISSVNLQNLYKEAVNYFYDYDTLMTAIYGSVDAANELPYWRLVCLTSACYYISYAMSNIPSLEIYALGLDNVDKAKAKYIKIYDIAEESDLTNFKSALAHADLATPFEEESFKLIKSIGNQYISNNVI